MPSFANLTPGDPAPWFVQRSLVNPNYHFDAAAGRYLVLCFFGSAADAHAQAAIAAVRERPDLFNDIKASFFGVSNDPDDEAEKRVADHYPGYRNFYDFDGTVSRLYGVLPREEPADGEARLTRRLWIVINPMLRIVAVVPFAADRSDVEAVIGFIERLPPVALANGMELHAPILVLPNVFEPQFCRQLIDLYEAHGGEESGFMRQVGGRTVAVHDHNHKRRRDYLIADPDIVRGAQARFTRRIVPMIHRAYQFKVTRMERYIVCRYDADDAGHFQPHRDNTTAGTAHRRFAVSVCLNDDYDGGELRFPEFGPRAFKPPAGGAVVFSCSLLHSVSRMTRGRRYVFLPFLYDDEAARVREANAQFLEGGSSYRSGLG